MKFPSDCWQLRKVRAFHQLPVGFTHNKAEQKLTVVWGQGGREGFLEFAVSLLHSVRVIGFRVIPTNSFSKAANIS